MGFFTNPLDQDRRNNPAVFPDLDTAGTANEVARADHTHKTVKLFTEGYNFNTGLHISQRGNGPFVAGTFTPIVDGMRIAATGTTLSTTRFALGPSEIPGLDNGYYLKSTVGSVVGATNYALLIYTIENIALYAGKLITVSFYAKSVTPNVSVAISLNQNYGTGGSPSPDITTVGVKKVKISSTWTKYTNTFRVNTLVGKTLGTNNDSVYRFLLWFDNGTTFNSRTNSLGHQSGVFDVTGFKVDVGNESSNTFINPLATDILTAYRYLYVSPAGQFSWVGQAYTTDAALIGLSLNVPSRATMLATIPAGPYTNMVEEVGIIQKTPTTIVQSGSNINRVWLATFGYGNTLILNKMYGSSILFPSIEMSAEL